MTGPVDADSLAGSVVGESPQSREWCARILGRLGPIAPLTDDEVLLADEVTHYRNRRHWASLAVPIIDLVAVALLWIAIFGVIEVAPSLGAVLALIFGAYIVVRIIETDNRKLWLIVILPLIAIFWFGVGDPAALGFTVLLFFGMRLLYRIARWRCYFILYVTDRRLLTTQGVFVRQIASMPIARVTDISLTTSTVGRLLDYGDFRVESAGQNQWLSRIRYLARPDEFHQIVLELTTRRVERSANRGDGT